MKIAFDVDDTLIVQDATGGRDVPNYDTIAVYRWFQAQGYYMIIWSGSGQDYARKWAEKLGLTPNEIRVKSVSNDVDIAFDDMRSANLGKVTVHARNLRGGKARTGENLPPPPGQDGPMSYGDSHICGRMGCCEIVRNGEECKAAHFEAERHGPGTCGNARGGKNE